MRSVYIVPGTDPNSSSMPTSSHEHRGGMGKHCDELSPEYDVELLAKEWCSENIGGKAAGQHFGCNFRAQDELGSRAPNELGFLT